MTSEVEQRPRHEPLYDINPRTGVSIEVFYADRALETFGRCGSGWFWCSRRRGFSPDGSPTGPFATSYAAYRHAMNTAAPWPEVAMGLQPRAMVPEEFVRG